MRFDVYGYDELDPFGVSLVSSKIREVLISGHAENAILGGHTTNCEIEFYKVDEREYAFNVFNMDAE